MYDIAKAQAKRGEFAGAFNTAILLKQTPPTDQKASDYEMAISDILVEMVKAGKGTEAKDTAAKFQDADVRPSWLYSGIAMTPAELGNLKEAKAALALAETETQRSARRKELEQLDDKLRFGIVRPTKHALKTYGRSMAKFNVGLRPSPERLPGKATSEAQWPPPMN